MKTWSELDESIRTAMVKHLGLTKAKWEELTEKHKDAMGRQAKNAIACTADAYPLPIRTVPQSTGNTSNTGEADIQFGTFPSVFRDSDFDDVTPGGIKSLMTLQVHAKKGTPERAALRDRTKQVMENLLNERRAKEKAEGAASSTLEEALSKWMRFNPPGMRADTKAKIQRAVQLYMTPDMRSESKIAAEFSVSRKQVSTWFKQFTAATGFPVVIHKRHESVRDHVHGPKHKQGRKIISHGEDKGTGTHDAEPAEDPFFAER